MRNVTIRALILGLSAAVCAAGTPAFAAGTPCEKLQALTIPDVTVTSAAMVPAGSFSAPGAQTPFTVPAFCRVQAVAKPTDDSDIRFEVWIPPADAWNGKFQGTGTGGYNGSISYGALVSALQRGYAATSTDTGHVGGDLVFGQGKPEKVIDWAYRAMHVTAEAGKLIVRNNQGKWPNYSYYVGCATGGHQALSEAQRYPDDYDGIIAGNPAYGRLHETAVYLWAWKATHDAAENPLLSQADLQTITRATVASCDAVDGVADGVIDDPRRCTFDVASLTCRDGATQNCLTPVQVEAVQKVYAGLRNPRTGEEIFPGYPVGSEGYGEAANAGWNAFLIQPKQPMRSEVYSYFLFHNPDWDWRTFDFDKDVAAADEKIGYMSAVDHDLTPFKSKGGKLILYTGWADPVLPAQDVIDYFDGVNKVMGQKNAEEFMRFYMVPGMGHCSGGPGPTSFDMLTELENWVEKGIAPKAVPAARVVDNAVQRTRLLCPYPQAARWTGKGSSDDAANFICEAAR